MEIDMDTLQKGMNRLPKVLQYHILGWVSMPYINELNLLFQVERHCQNWHTQYYLSHDHDRERDSDDRILKKRCEFSSQRILRRIYEEKSLFSLMTH